jgi:hypothetical protein
VSRDEPEHTRRFAWSAAIKHLVVDQAHAPPWSISGPCGMMPGGIRRVQIVGTVRILLPLP